MTNLVDVATLITAVATVWSVIRLGRQIEETRKHTSGQFLFELDAQFGRFEELHQKLLSEEPYHPTETDFVEIWQYVGLFERCKILIDYKTLDIATFEALYGYRLYSIVANDSIHASIQRGPLRHQHFIKLCYDVSKHKPHQHKEEHDHNFDQQIKAFKTVTTPEPDFRVPYKS